MMKLVKMMSLSLAITATYLDEDASHAPVAKMAMMFPIFENA